MFTLLHKIYKKKCNFQNFYYMIHVRKQPTLNRYSSDKFPAIIDDSGIDNKMASNKRPASATDSEEYQGFIHGLSPIKISRTNSKYFDFTLQINTSNYKRVVCFDASKRPIIDSAAKGKSPLKLSNYTESPSRTTTGTDIILNKKTVVQTARKLKFLNHQPETQSTTPTRNLTEVQALPVKSILSTTAKVMKIEIPKVQMLYGNPTNLQDIIVVDNTNQIRITLWDASVSSVQLDNTYNFENLSVRNFKNETYLTTTKSTKINRTEDLNNAVEYEATAAEIPTTIVGTVTEIKITQSYMCKSCTRKLPEMLTEEKYNRCTFCKMLQKTENFVSCLTATLNVESEDEPEDNQPSKLTIFNTQINNFCTLNNKEELLKDHLKMEEFFLEETFAFNLFDNIVDSFTVM
ncbi:uncharacterized protein [Mytilus edulis]|uniref:uncharacterized protein n=1 Tax=Mytilus edulis TaxID=6550 RepID=UPI0039EFFDA4